MHELAEVLVIQMNVVRLSAVAYEIEKRSMCRLFHCQPKLLLPFLQQR